MLQLVRIVYVRHAVFLNICSVAVVAVCVVFLLLSPRPASGVWQQRMLRIFFFFLAALCPFSSVVGAMRSCVYMCVLDENACMRGPIRSFSLFLCLSHSLSVHTYVPSKHTRTYGIRTTTSSSSGSSTVCLYTKK